jgi:multisubunit Na+/H+ antiporter MnhF subunit
MKLNLKIFRIKRLIISASLNALIGDIATAISIITIVKQVAAIDIAVIVAACRPTVASRLTAIDIFETFLVGFIASFVRSGSIN